MTTPQSGIFALRRASHAYLELDAPSREAGPDLVRAAASLREPRTTMGGVNLVAGFRPELWRNVSPEDPGNMPYRTVTDHGTMFVGFSADQQRLEAMLESMAGATAGVRDALTRYTRPLTGAYYFVPSTESLRLISEG